MSVTVTEFRLLLPATTYDSVWLTASALIGGDDDDGGSGDDCVVVVEQRVIMTLRSRGFCAGV